MLIVLPVNAHDPPTTLIVEQLNAVDSAHERFRIHRDCGATRMYSTHARFARTAQHDARSPFRKSQLSLKVVLPALCNLRHPIFVAQDRHRFFRGRSRSELNARPDKTASAHDSSRASSGPGPEITSYVARMMALIDATSAGSAFRVSTSSILSRHLSLVTSHYFEHPHRCVVPGNSADRAAPQRA
jgi:hypothetical protein